MRKQALLGLALMGLTGLGWAGQDSRSNDGEEYPTHEEVRFVNECIALHGGRSWGTLYKCSCVLDYIAARMPFDEFSAADTYRRGRDISGEGGDVLREPGEEGILLRQKLTRLQAKARNQCMLEAASAASKSDS